VSPERGPSGKVFFFFFLFLSRSLAGNRLDGSNGAPFWQPPTGHSQRVYRREQGVPQGHHHPGRQRRDHGRVRSKLHEVHGCGPPSLSLSLDFIVIIIVSVDLKNHLVGCAECSIVEAVEAASLHPAQVLGIADRKGTLNVGAEADFVLLDADMRVRATFVGGELAWSSL